jgi:hypothetical protein
MGGTGLSNRIIVGGGGGGAGGDRITNCGRGTGGGGGGGYYGGGGGAGWGSATVPTGGTQSAGGAAGISSSTYNGNAGALGIGGTGGIEVSSLQLAGSIALSGGTGGGLAGSAGQFSLSWTGQSGAAGSSYVSSMLTNTATTAGNRSGDGVVIISYNPVTSMTTAAVFPQQICTGQSATLSAGGMNSYTWSPGGSGQIAVSPSATTIYTVTGTSTLGCNQLATITLTVNNTLPTLSLSSSASSVCPNHTVMLNASGATTFSWTGGISNGVPFIPAATNGYTVSGANGCGTVTLSTTVSVTPLPVFIVAQPTMICAFRTSTLITGGAANYTWLPGNFTGTNVVVSPGQPTTYTVLGVNNVCSGSATLNLAVNPNPTITASASSTNICEGTAITLIAAGGSNYTWTPGGIVGQSITVNPATSTLFTATGINSFNCKSSANQIAVAVTAGPHVTAGTNRSLLCAGNSATLTAGGAHFYQWNAGPPTSSTVVNPITNTTYTVAGTHTTTGCSKTATVSVAMFSVNVNTSGPAKMCVGGSAQLTATGAGSYTWSNGYHGASLFVTPSVSTVYFVTATTKVSGMTCTSFNSVPVVVHALPVVTAAASHTAICNSETSILTAKGAKTYTWSNSGTAPTFTLRGTGNISHSFTVTGTGYNGCVNTATVAVKVSHCTSIEELSAEMNTHIYPNPNTGRFTVFINEPAKQTIQVYTIAGALIKSEEVNYQNTIIDLDQEPEGLYFVRIIEDNTATQTLRVVKN